MFLFESFIMDLPDACVVDVTPPTFAGIATLTANSNGSLTATWLAASDANPPLRYEVFIQKNTATGLFVPGNMALITDQLEATLFTDSDWNVIDTGTWFVGVRALDGIGNEDSNLVSLSAVSVGVIDAGVLTLAQAVNAALGVGVCAVGGVVEDDPDALIGVVDDTAVIGIVEEC